MTSEDFEDSSHLRVDVHFVQFPLESRKVGRFHFLLLKLVCYLVVRPKMRSKWLKSRSPEVDAVRVGFLLEAREEHAFGHRSDSSEKFVFHSGRPRVLVERDDVTDVCDVIGSDRVKEYFAQSLLEVLNADCSVTILVTIVDLLVKDFPS